VCYSGDRPSGSAGSVYRAPSYPSPPQPASGGGVQPFMGRSPLDCAVLVRLGAVCGVDQLDPPRDGQGQRAVSSLRRWLGSCGRGGDDTDEHPCIMRGTGASGMQGIAEASPFALALKKSKGSSKPCFRWRLDQGWPAIFHPTLGIRCKPQASLPAPVLTPSMQSPQASSSLKWLQRDCWFPGSGR